MERPLKIKIRLIVEPDDEAFHAYCPELPGLHVDGATEQEAVRNARDAVVAYLNSLVKHGDAIPVGVVQTEEPSTLAVLASTAAKLFQPKRRAYIEELCIGAA